MTSFNVGDIVEALPKNGYGITTDGWVGIVRRINRSGYFDVQEDSCTGTTFPDLRMDCFKLKNKSSSFMSSLKEIVAGLFTSEPQKSRQKAGITDAQGNLTSEGKDIFLNHLLNGGTAADFDSKIVLPVVAEMDKSSK